MASSFTIDHISAQGATVQARQPSAHPHRHKGIFSTSWILGTQTLGFACGFTSNLLGLRLEACISFLGLL